MNAVPMLSVLTEVAFGRHEALVWIRIKTRLGGVHTMDSNATMGRVTGGADFLTFFTKWEIQHLFCVIIFLARRLICLLDQPKLAPQVEFRSPQ